MMTMLEFLDLVRPKQPKEEIKMRCVTADCINFNAECCGDGGYCSLTQPTIMKSKCIDYIPKMLAIEIMPNLPEEFKKRIREKK